MIQTSNKDRWYQLATKAKTALGEYGLVGKGALTRETKRGEILVPRAFAVKFCKERQTENHMKKPETNVGKWEAQLMQWGKKLDELVAKSSKAGDKEESGLRGNIEELKVKYRSAQEKLEALKSAGQENWSSFEAGLERSWKELAGAFKNLTR